MLDSAEKLIFHSDAVTVFENESNTEWILDDVVVLANKNKLVWFLVGVTVVEGLKETDWFPKESGVL